MSTYLIGDIHGCYRELKELLKQVNFNKQKDELWITGDLVTRGPDSLKVLYFIKKINKSVKLVLGNNDLNLISVYSNIIPNNPKDKLDKILLTHDIYELITWLRCQPLLQIDNEKKIIMTHAGITPQWDLITAQKCAKELENILSSNHYSLLLKFMYNNSPNNWSVQLSSLSRLCFSLNALTRMRFCFPNGALYLKYKHKYKKIMSLLKPWFKIPRKIPKEYSIIFGHWASLKGQNLPNNIYGLDTGCCWGNKLTLLCWEDKKIYSQIAFKNHTLK